MVFVGMLMIYFHTRFHMTSSNGLLVINNKPRDNTDIMQLPCYFTLYKKITSEEVVYSAVTLCWILESRRLG